MSPRVLAFACGLAVSGSAFGQQLSWINGSGGSASVAANWSPSQLPNAGTPLLFNLNNTYGVTFNNVVPASESFMFRRGAVTLTLSNPHQTGDLFIGDQQNFNGAMTLTTGALTCAALLMGTPVSACTGSLLINDDDADLLVNGAAIVGETTIGTVTISGGGRLNCNSMILGDLIPTAQGLVLVTGASVTPPVASLLEIDTTDLVVGDEGHGELSVENGGSVTVADDLFIARAVFTTSAPSSGEVTVGSTVAANSTLNVGDDVFIGRTETGAGSAGNGTLTLNDGGHMTVGGDVRVGSNGTGTGVFTIDLGGVLNCRSLIAGANGTLNLDGGSINVDGGTFVNDETRLVLNAPGAGMTIHLQNLTSPVTLSPTQAGERPLQIGNNGRGLFHVLNSQVNITTNGFVVGSSVGIFGGLLLQSGGSLTFPNNATSIVGGPVAQVQLISGAMTGGTLQVSPNAGHDGDLLVSNSSEITLAGALTIGGTTAAAGGHGVLSVNTSTITVNGAGTSVRIHPNGELVMDGGLLDAGGDILFDRCTTNPQLDGGVMRAAAVRVEGCTLLGAGAVDARVFITPIGATPAAVTAVGTLNLGDFDIVNSLENDGVLNVGNQVVSLKSLGVTTTGDVTIAGGTLRAVDGMGTAIGDTISGFGTLDGDVTNAGRLTPTSTGLACAGIVTGVGQGISGTKMNFLSGGGFTGAGTIDAEIAGSPGALITPTGSLVMGRTSSTAGFSYGGTLAAGNRAVTLQDSNGAVLNGGGVFDIRGGSILCSNGIGISNGADVRGFGTLAATNPTGVFCSGLISPAGSGSDLTDQMLILGNATINPSGVIVIGIEGTATSDFDRLAVTGSLTLGGTLSVALNNPSFLPQSGTQSFTVITANGGLTGTFASLNLATPPRGGFRVEYDATHVFVKWCSVDYFPDGEANSNDVSTFLNLWFADQVNGTHNADFDGNGETNSNDVSLFLNQWFLGC